MPFAYETRGGTRFLTYRLGAAEKLDQDAYGMLESNKVPHVISPAYSQLDDARVLRFDMTGLQVVRDFFAGQALSRQHLIAVILGVADGFAAASDYLLEESMVACSLDCLYIDKELNVKMIYVPVAGFTGGVDARTFLNEVFVSLKPDKSGDVRHLVEIRDALESASGFSVGTFQKLLGSLTLKPPRARARGSAPLSRSADRGSAGLHAIASSQQPSVVLPGAPSFAGTSSDSGFSPSPSGGISLPSRSRSSGLPAPGRGSGSFGGMAIPPTAGSSSFGGSGDPGRLWPSVAGDSDKDEKPKKSLLSHKKRVKEKESKKNNKKEKPTKEKAPERKGLKGVFKKNHAGEIGNSDAIIPPSASRAGAIPFVIPGQGGLSGQYPPSPGGAPPISDACWQQQAASGPPLIGFVEEADGFGVTEVYGVSSNAGNRPVAGTAYLKRMRTGEVRPIDVTPFRIGRRRSEVDYYVPDRPRISRVHAIITYENGGFAMSDNDSANHTMVNGRELGSFEKVILAHGDRICMGDEEFLFLMS